MSGQFDPYHKWLGIPPEEQPPHYYRLLAIRAFEDDVDVVEAAADQRMAHLRTLQTGKFAKLSQQLLNEVAAARACLLDAKKRAVYDQRLRQQQQTEQAQRESAAAARTRNSEQQLRSPQPPQVATPAAYGVAAEADGSSLAAIDDLSELDPLDAHMPPPPDMYAAQPGYYAPPPWQGYGPRRRSWLIPAIIVSSILLVLAVIIFVAVLAAIILYSGGSPPVDSSPSLAQKAGITPRATPSSTPSSISSSTPSAAPRSIVTPGAPASNVGVSPSVTGGASADGSPFAVPVAAFGGSPGFNRIAFTADGKQLLALNLHRRIEMWDVAGRRSNPVPYHGSTLFDVACSPVDQRFAACGVDGVYLWNDARRAPQRIASRWFDKVGFMPNGERLLAGKNGVYSFDVRDPKSRQLGPPQTTSSPFGFDAFAASPDGKIVALTRYGSTNTVVFAVEPTFAGHQEPLLQVLIRGRLSAMAWSPDGRFFAVAKDQGVLIFDRRTGRQSKEFSASAPVAPRGQLVFLQRGTLLFWANGSEFHVFDVEAGQQRWYERQGRYNDFAVAPDGMTIAGCDFQGIKVWRIP